MTGRQCGYCFRPALAQVLVSTWFGLRKQWRPVCGRHLRKGAWRRG